MKTPTKRTPFSYKAKCAALIRAGGRCEKCHRPTDRFEFDHWTPVAYDGPSVLENCRALCIPCHRSVTRVFVKSHAKVRRISAKRREEILVKAMRTIARSGLGTSCPMLAEQALKDAGLE